MKTRLFCFAFLLASGILRICGQGFVVHLKDGSLDIFRSTDVEKMTVITEEESYLIGKWYLGFWKSGESVIHFDGTEYMAFAGSEMVWGGKGGDPATYSIKFYPNSKYFIAKNVAQSSDVLRWYVTQQTEKLLVLKDGDALRYFYPSKEAAANAQMELDPPGHRETTNITTILRMASGRTKSTITPMGKHFENRHQTTEEDREWLLNPSNEPEPVANMTRWLKKTVKLYPYGDPMPADVNQHAIGDCCALAVLASMAYLYPDFIKHIITDNGNSTYTVAMYDPQGNPVNVCVSSKILCDANGTIGQVTGKNNVITWATILEKALMKWETLYQVNGVEGIGTEHVAPLFTGDGESFSFSPNSLYTSELKLAIEYCLSQGMISVGGFNVGDLLCGTLKTVTGHAFTYMLANDENAIFNMRNPWGNGDKGEDGLLRIPDERTIVQTIDARIVNPGAAAPYLREDLQPYTPPRYIRRSTDIGVAPRLLNRMYTHPNATELW
ncbi:MAG: hypothetical protein J6W75_05570 [Bacteroidaceae bacterium]|nr:hypothetical protein [Bacteroidaceae bacterium]